MVVAVLAYIYIDYVMNCVSDPVAAARKSVCVHVVFHLKHNSYYHSIFTG